jgi:hypothetical protein
VVGAGRSFHNVMWEMLVTSSCPYFTRDMEDRSAYESREFNRVDPHVASASIESQQEFDQEGLALINQPD